MNIKDVGRISLTDDEWNEIDSKGKARLSGIASSSVHDKKIWYLYFYGISDKQTATELCAYFGLKVTG